MADLLGCRREPKPVVNWNPCSNGYYPVNGVQVGMDCNYTVYVARAWHKGALVPGKLIVGLRYATIPYEGKEIPCKYYEVLLAPPGVLKWVKSLKGERVEGAVIGGFTEDGEELYIGRVEMCGSFASGSIQPSRKCLLVPNGGGTVKKICTHCHPYEILVVDEKHCPDTVITTSPSYTRNNKIANDKTASVTSRCWPQTVMACKMSNVVGEQCLISVNKK